MILGHQEVVRLNVQVHDVFGVDVVQSGKNLFVQADDPQPHGGPRRTVLLVLPCQQCLLEVSDAEVHKDARRAHGGSEATVHAHDVGVSGDLRQDVRLFGKVEQVPCTGERRWVRRRV